MVIIIIIMIIMIMIIVMKHFLRFSQIFLIYFKETNSSGTTIWAPFPQTLKVTHTPPPNNNKTKTKTEKRVDQKEIKISSKNTTWKSITAAEKIPDLIKTIRTTGKTKQNKTKNRKETTTCVNYTYMINNKQAWLRRKRTNVWKLYSLLSHANLMVLRALTSEDTVSS